MILGKQTTLGTSNLGGTPEAPKMIEELIEKHKIHVLGLTETFQKEDSAIRVKYNQVSATRPTEKKAEQRGGVAIITRVGIALLVLFKMATRTSQAIVARVRRLTVAPVYISPLADRDGI